MKCDDARRSLETTRQQFASRYFRWCLAQCEREVDWDFAWIRRFPSSTAFRFVDFVESLPRERAREQARDLMVANVKFHGSVAAGTREAGMTESEAELRQRFLDMRSPPRVLHGQVVEAAYVSPREQELMRRDLDGDTHRWEPIDRKSFIAVLRRHLDTLFGPPARRSSSTLDYRVRSAAGTCEVTSTSADAPSSRARSGSKRAPGRIFAFARSRAVSICSNGAECIPRCAPT